MFEVLLKISLVLGTPTLFGIVLGLFLGKPLPLSVTGFSVGIVILCWVAIVKIRHIALSFKKKYLRQPDH